MAGTEEKQHHFINERIVPRKQYKKVLTMALTAVFLGLIFGAMAGISFYTSQGILKKNNAQETQAETIIIARDQDPAVSSETPEEITEPEEEEPEEEIQEPEEPSGQDMEAAELLPEEEEPEAAEEAVGREEAGGEEAAGEEAAEEEAAGEEPAEEEAAETAEALPEDGETEEAGEADPEVSGEDPDAEADGETETADGTAAAGNAGKKRGDGSGKVSKKETGEAAGESGAEDESPGDAEPAGEETPSEEQEDERGTGEDQGEDPEADPDPEEDTDAEEETGEDAAEEAGEAPEEDGSGDQPGEDAGEASEDDPESDLEDEDLYTALSLRDLYNSVSGGFVTVTIRDSAATDLFGKPVTRRYDQFGVIFLESEEYVYILSDGSKLSINSEVTMTHERRSVPVTVLEQDTLTNLMVLRVRKQSFMAPYTVIPLGNSFLVNTAQYVWMAGSPDGNPGAVDYGVVTYVNSMDEVTDGYRQLFTTNMQRSKGGSAVLFNRNCEIIGWISDYSCGQSERVYAAGISPLKYVIEDLCSAASTSYLGVKCMTVNSEKAAEAELVPGLYVTDVEQNSPAYMMGIQAGDRIVSINDFPVNDSRGLQDILDGIPNGKETVLLIERQGRDGEEPLKVVLYVGKR